MYTIPTLSIFTFLKTGFSAFTCCSSSHWSLIFICFWLYYITVTKQKEEILPCDCAIRRLSVFTVTLLSVTYIIICKIVYIAQILRTVCPSFLQICKFVWVLQFVCRHYVILNIPQYLSIQITHYLPIPKKKLPLTNVKVFWQWQPITDDNVFL